MFTTNIHKSYHMEKKETKKRTSFALSKKALDKLKQLAEKENRSMANMIEELIFKEPL